MRFFLPLGIHARTRVLDEGGGFSETSILLDRQHRDAPAAIVGHEHIMAGPIHRDVAGSYAYRGNLVQHGQTPIVRVEFVGAGSAALLAFKVEDLAYGIEVASVRMNGKE